MHIYMYTEPQRTAIKMHDTKESPKPFDAFTLMHIATGITLAVILKAANIELYITIPVVLAAAIVWEVLENSPAGIKIQAKLWKYDYKGDSALNAACDIAVTVVATPLPYIIPLQPAALAAFALNALALALWAAHPAKKLPYRLYTPLNHN